MIFIWAIILFIIPNTYSKSNIKNAKKAVYTVSGNCEMCKKNIESAAKINKTAFGIWDKNTKQIVLIFDSTKTSADEILRKIALVGYDNDKYLASNEAYNDLDKCCQYLRKELPKTKVDVMLPIKEVDNLNASISDNLEDPKNAEIIQKTDTIKQEPIIIAPIVIVKDSVRTNIPTNNAKVKTAVSKTDFTAFLTQYYAIKNALIADKMVAANKNAALLLVEIDAIRMDKLSSDEHMVWMKYFDKLKADATKINTSKDIEKQRTAFSSLSNNLWSTVKGLKIKDNGAIYIDYCPMKDAYWLSSEPAIKNPYYGSSMLTCGSIKETIK